MISRWSKNLIAVFVKSLCGTLINKILAQELGPVGYVNIGNILAISSAIQGIVNGSISTPVARLIAEKPSETSGANIIKTAICFALFVGFCITLTVFAFLCWIKPEWFNQSIITACVAVCLIPQVLALGCVIIGFLNGASRLDQLVIGNVIGSIGGLAVTYALVQFFGGLGGYLSLVANILIQSLVFLVVGLTGKNNPQKLKDIAKGYVQVNVARAMYPYIFTTLLTALIGPLTLSVVRQTLVSNHGLEIAGIWQAAWRFSELTGAPVSSMFSVFLIPLFAGEKTKIENRKSIITIFKYVGMAFAVGLATLILCKDFIILAIFSSEFIAMKSVIYYQFIGDFLKVISWIFGYLMLAKGASAQYATAEIIYSITLALTAYILIPKNSITGAVVAYITSYFVYLMYCVIATRRMGFI
jgi:PST family polysaccharide transporter